MWNRNKKIKKKNKHPKRNNNFDDDGFNVLEEVNEEDNNGDFEEYDDSIYLNRHSILEEVMTNGLNLKNYGSNARNDRKIVLAAVEENGKSLEFASEELRNDETFLLESLFCSQCSIEFAGKKLNKEFWFKVVEANVVWKESSFLEYASEELRNDKKFISEAIERGKNLFFLGFASEELRNDKEFILSFIGDDKQWGMRTNLDWFESVGDSLRNDKDIVFEAVKRNGLNLQYASSDMRNDKDIVFEAVKRNGNSLQHASSDMRNDKDIVFEAVKRNGLSLQHASFDMRNDKDIVFQAVKRNGNSLQHASSGIIEKLGNDKTFFLEAISISKGLVIRSVSEEMKNDKEIAIAAVKQNGMLLEVLSYENRNDKEIVFEAVKENGLSISHANERFRNDKEIVLAAVKQTGWSLEFASEELQKDRDVLSSCNHVQVKLKTISRFEMFQEREEDGLMDILENVTFDDLRILQYLGRGAFGGTYRCRLRKVNLAIFFVVKIYNDPFLGIEKKKEIVGRDNLKIPHHKNVVSILKGSTNEKIDLGKLPDYETFWKDFCKVRYIQDCGMVLMRFFETTLKGYLEEMKKNNFLFEIIEVRRMFWGLLSGVCHLFKNMIVHRDLHPDNIFVEPYKGRILIGDFGCTLDLRGNKNGFKVHKDHEQMFSFTENTYFRKEKSGALVGFRKGGYAKMFAPEIRNFDPLKDGDFLDYEKCDIYSIGFLGRLLLEQLKKDDDFGLPDLIEKLVEEDPEKRLGCFEAISKGKFIEVAEDLEGDSEENFAARYDRVVLDYEVQGNEDYESQEMYHQHHDDFYNTNIGSPEVLPGPNLSNEGGQQWKTKRWQKRRNRKPQNSFNHQNENQPSDNFKKNKNKKKRKKKQKQSAKQQQHWNNIQNNNNQQHQNRRRGTNRNYQIVRLKSGEEIYIDMNQVSPHHKPRGLIKKQMKSRSSNNNNNQNKLQEIEEEEEEDNEDNEKESQLIISRKTYLSKKKKTTSLKRAILNHRLKNPEPLLISSRDIENRVTQELKTKSTQFLKKTKQLQQNEWKKYQTQLTNFQNQQQQQTNIIKKKKKKKKLLKPEKRFVFGFSESIQKLRFFKFTQVKLIIFATDIEKVDGPKGTMEKITKIKKMAKEHKVPVIFSLKRRQIGKCLGKPLKVAVLNIKKAVNEFQELIKEYEKERKTISVLKTHTTK